MADEEQSPPRRTQSRKPDPSEGVRIIGAEEAQAAIEREDVAQRLPEDAPRFGDRPERPPADGPRPAIRFPLSGAEDARDIERSPVVPPDPGRGGGDVAMPHWTEPATGEVPRIFGGPAEGADDLDAWSSFTSSQPRWRGEGPAYEAGEYDDFSRLADDDTRIGALDPNRPDPEEFFEFEPEPENLEQEDPVRVSTTRSISSGRRAQPAPGAGPGYERPSGSGRDLPTAVAVGLGLGGVFLLLAKLGPAFVLAMVAGVLTLCAVELFNAVRKAGYPAATLLGIVAVPCLALGAYWKGVGAYPVVLVLVVIFGLLWYLFDAGGDESPVLGLSVTLLGVGYIGVLGGFGALILGLPSGVGIFLGAVLATVGYDIGAFFVGRSFGSRPLSAASPNKSVEGLLGGCIGSVMLGGVLTSFLVHPWSGGVSLGTRLLFGLVAAAAATLGDLCESLIKRDFGVKDMGSLLPGHGGVLDRFDAMLFVLPTTYYFVQYFSSSFFG